MARISLELVPVTNPIRTRSIPNVGTERLVGRLEHLREMFRDVGRWTEQKSDVRGRVREVVNIERELRRRAVSFDPVSDGRHLAIDVWTVREIRPPVRLP